MKSVKADTWFKYMTAAKKTWVHSEIVDQMLLLCEFITTGIKPGGYQDGTLNSMVVDGVVDVEKSGLRQDSVVPVIAISNVISSLRNTENWGDLQLVHALWIFFPMICSGKVLQNIDCVEYERLMLTMLRGETILG